MWVIIEANNLCLYFFFTAEPLKRMDRSLSSPATGWFLILMFLLVYNSIEIVLHDISISNLTPSATFPHTLVRIR